MQVLGHFARVSLDAVRNAIDPTSQALESLLGTSELQASRRFLTLKRRTEFFGGRVAAKLAYLANRKGRTKEYVSLSCLDIPPTSGSSPTIYCLGRACGTVSISHSGRWAVSFVSRCGRGVVDVEDDVWGGRSFENFFSAFELGQIQDKNDAQIRWTLKECCLKMANDPEFDLLRDTTTVLDSAHRRLVATKHRKLLHGGVLGTFKWGELAAAIGIIPKDV
jgi:hypothetical protein